MKIAFVGDSFCMNVGWTDDNEASNDWPRIIANELKADIVQQGHGGTHFYHAATEFLPKMLATDIVIFCVSEPYRMINQYNLPITLTWIDQMHDQTGDHWAHRQQTADELNMPISKLYEIANAGYLYYKYLFDQPSCEFFQIGFISFIDSLMKQHNKKAIWFPCFKQSLQLPDFPNVNKQFIPTSGPSANIALDDLSMAELKHKGLWQKQIDHIRHNDDRRNHFNTENNRRMATIVLNIIENDKFSAGVIKMENHFSYMNLDEVRYVQ